MWRSAGVAAGGTSGVTNFPDEIHSREALRILRRTLLSCEKCDLRHVYGDFGNVNRRADTSRFDFCFGDAPKKSTNYDSRTVRSGVFGTRCMAFDVQRKPARGHGAVLAFCLRMR